MTSSPFPDANLQKKDYWILGVCRDASAITLFIVAPVLQLIFFRWLPLACLLSLAILLLGHALSGWRYFSPAVLSIFTHPSAWPRAHRFLGASYAAFVGWAILSLLWSPLPLQGLRDIALLIIAPVMVLVLAHEQARAIAIPFPKILGVGLIMIIILISLELAELTSFHTLAERQAGLYDLNRNAVLLTLLFWPLVLMIKKPSVINLISFIILYGVITLVSWKSWSESAQLMFAAAGCTWVLTRHLPRLYHLVFAGISLAILIFPLILNPVVKSVASLHPTVFGESAVQRTQYWQEYKRIVMEKPVVGWGVRANRYFGSTENIAKDTSEQKFTTIAPHPHNVAMEFWTDYGLIGILLLSFTLISFGNATSTLPAKKRSILAVISVACFSYSMTGAAFMQGWWIGSMAMVAIAFIAANRSHILVE